ncbi:hypothetical protein H2200_005291 [Cladophialophora chaetospira]|uniref:Uncharacterized protein n=1 Tax=Cladophialophora chaetospira TaxID=386627 RepID=A0AA39CIT3_9EURO|nr:hypothetical protein H2200_005291 [Cladophialophora chaetospira]
MDGSKFLKLVPEEGRQYAPASAFIAPAKPESPTLRRVPSFEDLKTKINNDGAWYSFLKLTPDLLKKPSVATSGSHDQTKENTLPSCIQGEQEKKGNSATS